MNHRELLEVEWSTSHLHEWHWDTVTSQGINTRRESHFDSPDNHLLAIPVNFTGTCPEARKERVICTRNTCSSGYRTTHPSESSRTLESVKDPSRSNEESMLKILSQYIATCCLAGWWEQMQNENSTVSAVQSSPEPGRRVFREAQGQPH